MAWQDNKPSPSDIPNAELSSLISGNKLFFRQAIERHSFWTDSSGASIGVPRLSDGSFGPGAARAYFDVYSNLSTSDRSTKALSGRLFLASDTSRLFGFSSETATVLLGSKDIVVYQTGSQATIPTNMRVLVQIGSGSIVATSSGTSLAAVTFPSAYSAAPHVQVTPMSASVHTVNLAFVALTSITASGFSVALRSHGATAYATTFWWRSHGSVAL